MIALYNLEKYTNIALEKIRMFYEWHGETMREYHPIEHGQYDTIYCSSIFTYSNKSYVLPDMICGGTGFDLITTLPPEIDEMKPKINMGFTTRGCIRHCPFCVVPQKEGNIRVVGDIYDFWDRKSKEITILDNNISAMHHHFWNICQQIKMENLKVDFNQGLDFRCMDRWMVSLLKDIKMPLWRFAWDNIKDATMVINFLNLLREENVRATRWYVLIGFNSTKEEDYERVMLLKGRGHDPFVMPYNKHIPYQRHFARWVNHKAIFKSVLWAEYRKNKIGKPCSKNKGA